MVCAAAALPLFHDDFQSKQQHFAAEPSSSMAGKATHGLRDTGRNLGAHNSPKHQKQHRASNKGTIYVSFLVQNTATACESAELLVTQGYLSDQHALPHVAENSAQLQSSMWVSSPLRNALKSPLSPVRGPIAQHSPSRVRQGAVKRKVQSLNSTGSTNIFLPPLARQCTYLCVLETC